MLHNFFLNVSSGCYCDILFGLRKHLQLKQLPFVMGQGFNYIQFLNRFTITRRSAGFHLNNLLLLFKGRFMAAIY